MGVMLTEKRHHYNLMSGNLNCYFCEIINCDFLDWGYFRSGRLVEIS